jgi:two-component system sensor histidine kinase QseC
VQPAPSKNASGTVAVLQAPATSLAHRLERAEESREWCLKFISRLIHDMSQPLTVLYGEIHLALTAPSRESEYRAVLEASAQQVDALTRLVNRLRELAHVEKRGSLDRGTSLLAPVQGAIETFHRVAESKHVKIALAAEGDSEVAIPADRLKEAVHQLLNLAVERTPEGGSISLQISVSPTIASLRVDDQGPALPPEELALLLDPLTPSPNRRVKLADTRLEWCLAKRMAEVWWGTFEVESKRGQGCQATLTLPRWVPGFPGGGGGKVA